MFSALFKNFIKGFIRWILSAVFGIQSSQTQGSSYPSPASQTTPIPDRLDQLLDRMESSGDKFFSQWVEPALKEGRHSLRQIILNTLQPSTAPYTTSTAPPGSHETSSVGSTAATSETPLHNQPQTVPPTNTTVESQTVYELQAQLAELRAELRSLKRQMAHESSSAASQSNGAQSNGQPAGASPWARSESNP